MHKKPTICYRREVGGAPYTRAFPGMVGVTAMTDTVSRVRGIGSFLGSVLLLIQKQATRYVRLKRHKEPPF